MYTCAFVGTHACFAQLHNVEIVLGVYWCFCSFLGYGKYLLCSSCMYVCMLEGLLVHLPLFQEGSSYIYIHIHFFVLVYMYTRHSLYMLIWSSVGTFAHMCNRKQQAAYRSSVWGKVLQHNSTVRRDKLGKAACRSLWSRNSWKKESNTKHCKKRT
jgi:hypothetical protein